MTSTLRRPEGFVTISRFTGDDGRVYSNDDARRFGWIKGGGAPTPAGWGIGQEEFAIGHNLFTDAGRQLLAYCFGFQPPVTNYVIASFGLGTGTQAPKVTDTTLQNPLVISANPAMPPAATDYLSPIDGVTYTAPFIASVLFTLSGNMANGYLLTEVGLFSGNGTLYARRTNTAGLNKTSDFSPQLSWRIRF